MYKRTDKVARGLMFEGILLQELSRVIDGFFLSDLTFYSTQIEKESGTDLVMITSKGVFVIEAKNYRTRLIGMIESSQWIGVTYSNTNLMYNVYKQNKLHKRLVMNFLLDMGVKGIPVFDVIIVNNTCEVQTDFERAFTIEGFYEWYAQLPEKGVDTLNLYQILELYNMRG